MRPNRLARAGPSGWTVETRACPLGSYTQRQVRVHGLAKRRLCNTVEGCIGRAKACAAYRWAVTAARSRTATIRNRRARKMPLVFGMLLRRVAFPDFCEPCLPSPAAKPPAGAGWLHEIKHDGYRMLVRRDTAGVRLFTRNGHDWTGRFPLIGRAALSVKAVSCLIDGEAVACDDDGMPCFDRLRYRRADGHVFLYAFDLIELDGEDVRREPIERRKVLLIRLLAKASVGLQVNDHIEEPGDIVFRHAC